MQLIEQFLRLGLLMFVTVDILVTNKKNKNKKRYKSNRCLLWLARKKFRQQSLCNKYDTS